MLETKDLLTLMKTVAKSDPSAPVSYSYEGQNLSYDAMQETLRSELNELASSYSAYRENKNTIFSLIEQTFDEILPQKILDRYGDFAEVKTFAQGDKPIFTRRTGKQRAKQFITRVGLAGIYEVFKLGQSKFEVPTSAIGGAAQIGLEEFLDGRVDFAELTQIVMDGMDDLIYSEIAKALTMGLNQLPALNKYSENSFNEVLFDRAIATAASYGVPTIYCTQEFAATIPTQLASASNRMSEKMKDEYWANGHLLTYKGGYRIVILPQSFTDETNQYKVFDPKHCWIIPAGADKPVKIAIEGQTIVDEYVNKDRSREVQVYKKVGVAAFMTNNIVHYENTSLSATNLGDNN